MLNFKSNGPSGAELFAILYFSIFSYYIVKRAWSNPWLNPAGNETKVNQGCSILRCGHFGNKIESVRPFCQKSVFFLYRVSKFYVFMLREPDFNKLWSLNERSWNFETLGIGSKGPFLS